jgi:pimeloyl-ACP methyl ester carboxylesterase
VPFLRYRGSRLHFLERGSGEPVLLVHGLGSSGADWAFQVPALQSRFRVLIPDLPGCGHSEPASDACSVEMFAAALWALLDELEVPSCNIIGFSLGGAVALEMALQRPGAVPRLALINSLASYRVDHWRKWIEARIPVVLVRALGMRRAARIVASRLFPDPWQQPMRERAENVIGAVEPRRYLDTARALERWSATDRLGELRCRTLLIAAEYDYTPLAEKRALATQLGARIVEVRGSRHGTPFDAIEATNASLLAHLMDGDLPPAELHVRDAPERAPVRPSEGSVADEHAAAP